MQRLNSITLGASKNVPTLELKTTKKLNLSLSTPDKDESQHPPALTPGGSFSPMVKELIESVMPTLKKVGQCSRHRRNHSGGSLRHLTLHDRTMIRGRSLDQVDASEVLVDIEQLNLLATEDGVTESQSELDSLQRPQLVNLAVSDSEVDGEGAEPSQVMMTSPPNNGVHEDSSSVDLLDTMSSQGEEGDDEEDYQPSSDPLPETPTHNEEYSSPPSSPDQSYATPPNPVTNRGKILNKQGNVALLKCYYDSPRPKVTRGELNDSGFHVS